MITRFDSLDIAPEDGIFFLPHHFNSSLKGDTISEENYNALKKLYRTLKLKKLGELNKSYNFQDKIILCKIFESRASYLQKTFKFNQRKCSSASYLSGCVQRDKSKCLIAVPTDVEQVKDFKRILIGGYTSVNTCLAFDSQILMPKNKRDNLKLIYVLTYGCIKKSKNVTPIRDFNIILNTLSHEDKIGHLFIVDIKFHKKSPKTLAYNEIYTPIFKKQKIVKAYERSVLQILRA